MKSERETSEKIRYKGSKPDMELSYAYSYASQSGLALPVLMARELIAKSIVIRNKALAALTFDSKNLNRKGFNILKPAV